MRFVVTSGSEERNEDAEVILGRDLSASMEKEWEVLKNDDDTPVLEDANTETTNDNKGMNQIKSTNHFSSFTFLNPNVFSFAESKDFETFERLVQVDHHVPEEAIQRKIQSLRRPTLSMRKQWWT